MSRASRRLRRTFSARVNRREAGFEAVMNAQASHPQRRRRGSSVRFSDPTRMTMFRGRRLTTNSVCL